MRDATKCDLNPSESALSVNTQMVTRATTEIVSLKTKRIVSLRRVNCRWLYNQVQASRGIILIDTRSHPDYLENSIPTALSLPPLPKCSSFDEMLTHMLPETKEALARKKRHLRDVVLFGNVARKSLVASGDVTVLASEAAIDTTYDQTIEDEWNLRLAQALVEDGLVTSVKILIDGFQTFNFRYPFCTCSSETHLTNRPTRTSSGTHCVNYPNEVLEGFLFLGNMWHAQSEDVIRNLGITHVVNASLDIENVFEHENVLYHSVNVKDRPESDISQFFDSTFAFIEEAKRTSHGRVLVHCTQGISRSATLIIMYLMRAHHWSLVTAANFAIASRGVVYPNIGFLLALMQEEFRLYNGNSITEEEFDLLVQNQLPDRPLPLEVIQRRVSDKCSFCCKIFSLLEWRHQCSFCKQDICSKCSSLRIANQPLERKVMIGEDSRRSRRVCDNCVSRLGLIQLPRPRKGLHIRYGRCKRLHVSGLSAFAHPVQVFYFERTESHVLMEILKKRFRIKANEIIEIENKEGNPITQLSELPDDASIFISTGTTGTIHDIASSHQEKPLVVVNDAEIKSSSGENAKNISSTRRKAEECTLLAKIEAKSSFDVAISSDFATQKFTDLWKLSFPNIEIISEEQLVSISKSVMVADLMLAMSSLSCGTITQEVFSQRVTELGYTKEEKDVVIPILQKACGRIIL
uniref:Dual specificity phosphatase putative n=1 Tax=Albugo laibachii Nc14 TaxID=890382 RepID=F0W5K5_9STRA|nr:dual specificity phosphatase putative [Albugo laibachii Nc14]|eukprot:CCA16396.1 dual specificity phosphatase putative [Albugo laibachii Nc14]